MHTVDPLLIILTSTAAGYAWDRDPNCNEFSSSVQDCDAANPSILGTHWFVDSCQKFTRIFSGTCGDILTSGTYHNDDFGLDSERTNVGQLAQVERATCDGSGVGRYFHPDSGEGSSLIFAYIAESAHANCTCEGSPLR